MLKRFGKKRIVLTVTILLLLLVVIYSGLQLLKPTVFDSGEESTDTKTIERDNKKYFPRQDINVFLIMGIDKLGKVESSGSYRNSGACDVVALAIFDESDKSYRILCLNRDLMLKMPVLGVGGKKAGSVTQQLALAHTYGEGLKDSCENVKTTVSDFLYGLEIDYYVSLNMDAIGILNDSVGGVRVNVTDDFSAVDPTIKKGEMLLNAQQALTFVQTRKGVGDEMNLSRMERHKEYMNGFFEALGTKLDSNSKFAISAMKNVSDYMVTDCSPEVLGTFASRYSDYVLKEIVTVEGINSVGDGYMEFYPDEEKLDSLILRLFYEEKK